MFYGLIDRAGTGRLVVVFSIFLLLFPFSPAWAQTTDIDGLTVTLPQTGWNKVGKTTLFMLQKEFPETDKDKRGTAMIQIMKPVSAARNSLPAGLKTFVNTLPDMAKEDITVKHYGVTVNGHDIRVEDRCCASMKGVSVSQIVVGIAGDKRQAYLQLVQFNLRGDRSSQAEAEFAALVRSVKLDPSDKDFEIAPSGGDGGLDGVFTYLDTGLRPNVFGGMDFYSDSLIKVFDQKGIFSTELPKGGLSIAEHCRENPTECGLYSLKGGGFFSAGNIELRSVTSDYGTIEPEASAFAKSGKNIKIGEREYRAIPAFKDGATLDGEWTFTFASSGMTATSSGSVASSRTLTLKPDGTFRRTGWHGASASNEIAGSSSGLSTTGKRAAETGTYTLSGYRLDLRHATGQTETLSIFEPDVGSDKLLVINGSNYLKDDD
ncbi:hypothetical protein KX729_06780 [Rhizobium sp. XQZ8]|uniref:hypothetical protein n=1 Tax=Rhizobium populisoli TaxID=2859785 RepID=UPI001CA47D25|nr:hypothetical protein [Rhizobium populisoli]MBW6421142.1 hypothetical protein [Rhizobium populisoli]